MAFVRLTSEKNPKLAVGINTAINYKDKNGELKQRKPETAFIDVINEAGKVAGMEQGSVTMAIEINGQWENFFVNRDENHNISLKPINDPYDIESTIYINSHKNKDGNFYCSLNDKTIAGKALKEGIGVSEYVRENGEKSSYIKANVRLANPEIKKQLLEKGEGYLAIVSKDNVKVVSEADLSNMAKEQKNQEKEGVVKFPPREVSSPITQEIER